MNTLLEEAIEAWDGARRGVIAEAAGIPARDWDFRPAPGARSVAELVGHVVATGMMWTNELTRPTADFTRKSFPAFIRHYAKWVEKPRPRAEWLRLLRSSYRDGARQLRAQMLRPLRGFRRFLDDQDGHSRLPCTQSGASSPTLSPKRESAGRGRGGGPSSATRGTVG